MGGHATTGAGRSMDGAPGQDEGELGRVDGAGEEGCVLYRLRRPRAPRPAPARRRLEGRRVHGARRRGQLRVVRRDTHGCEGNPGDHEQGVPGGHE